MKNFNFLSLTILGIALLASSCDSEKACPENPLTAKNQVKFTASINDAVQTRASGTTWAAGDQIGVYASNAGSTFPNGFFDDNVNVKYTTPGDGNFTASTSAIVFPETGALDFVAYYPYKEIVANYEYGIDVANQTNSANIDVLYSNNAVNVSAQSSSVNLIFSHALSMIVINVEAGAGVASLDGLTASISGLTTDGKLLLANGSVALGTTKAAIVPNGSAAGTAGTFAAILVPGQNLNTATVTFTLNGKVYEWTPDSKDLAQGKKYVYNRVQLASSGVAQLSPGAVITDWDEEVMGTDPIVVTPGSSQAITLSTTQAAIQASGTLTADFTITADAAQAWSVGSDQTWLTAAPASGTGNGTVTLTAGENTGTTERTATVTITATGTDPLETQTITVTQAGATPPQPATTLLFAGSDFEDWTAFTNTLSSHGLKEYAVQSDGGRNGTKALHLNGTPTGNDYVFTSKVPSGFSTTGKSKIVFYIKGTSSAKSLSFNVYRANGTNYNVFNLETPTGDVTLVPTNLSTSSNNGTNSYTGTINTGGNWFKVTLDLSTIITDISSTEGASLFSLKTGRDSVFNLLVDDITIE